MLFRSLAVTLAAGVALAACSSPAEPPPPSVESAVPGTTAPTSVPAETPEPTQQAGMTGEQLQAMYDAAVASQPGHPLIRQGLFQYGYLELHLFPDPVDGDMVVVNARIGGEPQVNPYGHMGTEVDGEDVATGTVIPAAGVQLGTHWDAAWALNPDCPEADRTLSLQPVPSGVPGIRFQCGVAGDPIFTVIADQQFELVSDPFDKDEIAVTLAAAEAAGAETFSSVLWHQYMGVMFHVAQETRCRAMVRPAPNGRCSPLLRMARA